MLPRTWMWPDTASSDTPDSIQVCSSSRHTCAHVRATRVSALSALPLIGRCPRPWRATELIESW